MPLLKDTESSSAYANKVFVNLPVVILDLKNKTNHTFYVSSDGDDDVVAQFRFMRRDIPRLRDARDLLNEITCHFYQDPVVDSTEALYIVLSRLAYPCRYVDMVPLFGRSVPQLSMIFTQTIDLNIPVIVIN